MWLATSILKVCNLLAKRLCPLCSGNTVEHNCLQLQPGEQGKPCLGRIRLPCCSHCYPCCSPCALLSQLQLVAVWVLLCSVSQVPPQGRLQQCHDSLPEWAPRPRMAVQHRGAHWQPGRPLQARLLFCAPGPLGATWSQALFGEVTGGPMCLAVQHCGVLPAT